MHSSVIDKNVRNHLGQNIFKKLGTYILEISDCTSLFHTHMENLRRLIIHCWAIQQWQHISKF